MSPLPANLSPGRDANQGCLPPACPHLHEQAARQSPPSAASDHFLIEMVALDQPVPQPRGRLVLHRFKPQPAQLPDRARHCFRLGPDIRPMHQSPTVAIASARCRQLDQPGPMPPRNALVVDLEVELQRALDPDLPVAEVGGVEELRPRTRRCRRSESPHTGA